MVRLGGIRYAPEALVAAQHLHDLENAGRGERAGKRGAHRLGHRPELHALGAGKIAQKLFENSGAPIGFADIGEIGTKCAEKFARFRGQYFCGIAVQLDRPRRDVEPSLFSEFYDRLSARL
jgi:hypothetical protein